MSDLRERIDVVPLSAATWERVEGAIFAELDAGLASASRAADPPVRRRARARAGWIAAACVAAAAVAALAWVAMHDASTHPVRVASGSGEVETNAGDAIIRLAPHTVLYVLGDEAQGWVVLLDGGTASFSVPPRLGRSPFAIHAGDVRVSVVGTELTVSRDRNDVRVAVRRGVVDVARDGRTARVEAGEHWPATAPATATDTDTDTDTESESDTESDSDTDTDSESDTATESDAVAAPRATAQARTRTADDARRRFDEASRLEARDPAAAVAIYDALVREGGPWAANALFAEARVELDRGRRNAARTLLTDYLRRHPRGANAQDARELLETLTPEESPR